MGARGNKRQTMAKMARERMVKERRALKDERKLARKQHDETGSEADAGSDVAG
jgi:hypothetical protein